MSNKTATKKEKKENEDEEKKKDPKERIEAECVIPIRLGFLQPRQLIVKDDRLILYARSHDAAVLYAQKNYASKMSGDSRQSNSYKLDDIRNGHYTMLDLPVTQTRLYRFKMCYELKVSFYGTPELVHKRTVQSEGTLRAPSKWKEEAIKPVYYDGYIQALERDFGDKGICILQGDTLVSFELTIVT